MSHGFPLLIGSNFGLVTSTAVYVGSRWKEGKYVPLATEAYGIYEIVIGSYVIGLGCKAWIEDYRSGTTSRDLFGFTPRTIIECSKDILVDGIFHATYLPCATGKCAYNLAARSIKVLYSA